MKPFSTISFDCILNMGTSSLKIEFVSIQTKPVNRTGRDEFFAS